MDLMESLDITIPQEMMLWSGKADALSPDHLRSFVDSLASSSATSCSTSPLSLGEDDSAAAGQSQLWPIEDDIFLTYFHNVNDAISLTPSAFEQQYHDTKEEVQKKCKAEELLQDLIAFKQEEEEGDWQDLSLLTSGAGVLGNNLFTDPSIYSTTTTAINQKIVSESSSDYVADTELIFNEIKTFCSDFEAAGYQHLTPPQTPPPKQTPMSPPMFANQYQGMNISPPPQQQQQLPNIYYEADAPSMTSSPVASAATSPLQYGQRSLADLQLDSIDCLDKTFVIPEQDEIAAPQPIVVKQAGEEEEVIGLIEELLGNTKDVYENYVLVSPQISATRTPDAAAIKQIEASITPRCFVAPQSVQMDDSVDYSDDNATQYSTPSYGHSLASSPSRSGSPMDDDMEDTQDDDEWMPASMDVNKKQKRSSSSSGSMFAVKRRPYERGGGELEKKTRKKEQNKNAATRYRQKKKQEVETILEEETRLRKTHKKLMAQFNEGRREMKYLKNLLREMYRQNGVLI